MNKISGTYQVVELSAERRGMAAFQELKADRHSMYALLEVDVSTARDFIEEYKAITGETLSFSGYLIGCLARAVDEDKTVQAYRKGSKKVVMFDDVDVGFMIELKKGEKHILRGHVIRGANRKRLPRDCTRRSGQCRKARLTSEDKEASWFRSALLLPWPLSSLFKSTFRMMLKNDPTIATSMAGTVGISSVGMFGKGHSGWGISNGSHVLDLVVGGIARKPVEVEGKIALRELMNLTIIFDHDVIDGAPATRFTRKLIELIESGYGLDEYRREIEKSGV